MMRLPCPWCGECDEIEFVYGGPSALLRPALEASDETWGRYLYFRANVKGQASSAASCLRLRAVVRH